MRTLEIADEWPGSLHVYAISYSRTGWSQGSASTLAHGFHQQRGNVWRKLQSNAFYIPFGPSCIIVGTLENKMVSEKTEKESAVLADIDALHHDSNINTTVRWPSGLRRQVKVYLNKFPGPRKRA